MKDKQLWIIFVWMLFGFVIAQGLLPLLPVYAVRLGAEASLVGYYMAFAYVMMASGSLLAGWLARRTLRWHRWLLASSAGVPMGILLMSWADSVWQLAAATGLVWLCFGLMSPLTNALIGLRASGAKRGRVFGAFGMNKGLGSFIGGAIMGPAADRWGYEGMLLVAVVIGMAFLVPVLFVRDAQASGTATRRREDQARTQLGWRYWAFLAGIMLVGVTGYVAIIGRSLVMDGAGFDATAISSATAIAGLVGLLVTPAVGWLSDRVGRRGILVAAFGLTALALWLLSVSTALWQFWAVAVMLAIGGARDPIQRAWVTDSVPQEALGVGMAFLAASTWVGGIIGFGLAGSAMQSLGARTALLSAAFLPVLAIVTLFLTHFRMAASAS